jgi:fumarate reductase subunit D
VCVEVFTEELFTTTTIEASATEFAVVSNNTVSDFEAFHFETHVSDDADGLVAGDERKLSTCPLSSLASRGQVGACLSLQETRPHGCAAAMSFLLLALRPLAPARFDAQVLAMKLLHRIASYATKSSLLKLLYQEVARGHHRIHHVFSGNKSNPEFVHTICIHLSVVILNDGGMHSDLGAPERSEPREALSHIAPCILRVP